LRIKLPPTFAIRWIVPRLARLHAIDRSLDVQITTSHSPADFDREEIDIAIHSGEAPVPGTLSVRLFGEVLTPVCSPTLLQNGNALREPADLKSHTLLCSLHRPHDWPVWIEAAGLTGIDGNSGLKFENSSLTYQAAIDRLGIAMRRRLSSPTTSRPGGWPRLSRCRCRRAVPISSSIPRARAASTRCGASRRGSSRNAPRWRSRERDDDAARAPRGGGGRYRVRRRTVRRRRHRPLGHE
jgi:LysR family transcriptional regulator, glycine cleavage system transcriptional activator